MPQWWVKEHVWSFLTFYSVLEVTSVMLVHWIVWQVVWLAPVMIISSIMRIVMFPIVLVLVRASYFALLRTDLLLELGIVNIVSRFCSTPVLSLVAIQLHLMLLVNARGRWDILSRADWRVWVAWIHKVVVELAFWLEMVVLPPFYTWRLWHLFKLSVLQQKLI